MPVKDRNRMRLVRLGIIRLGHKAEKQVAGGKTVTYPVQDDHFVLTDAPEIAEVYGDTPRELDVMLPFPDVERNFDGAYTVWAGGVLVCKGDGETVQYAAPMRTETKTGRDGKTRTAVYNAEGDTLVDGGIAQLDFSWNGSTFQEGETVPCPGASRDLYPHCAACKLSSVLKVMMSKPELFRMGYYQIATGSGRNYDTILGTLDLVSGGGIRKLNGIPFKLRMVKEATTYTESGKRKSVDKWFLQLEPDPEFTRKLYVRQAEALIGTPAPVAAIPETTGEYVDGSDEVPPPFAQSGGPAGDWDDDLFNENEPDPEPEPGHHKPGGKMADDRHFKRWSELVHKADALGIEVEAIRPPISVDDLTARADALKAEMAAAEAEMADAAQEELPL